MLFFFFPDSVEDRVFLFCAVIKMAKTEKFITPILFPDETWTKFRVTIELDVVMLFIVSLINAGRCIPFYCFTHLNNTCMYFIKLQMCGCPMFLLLPTFFYGNDTYIFYKLKTPDHFQSCNLVTLVFEAWFWMLIVNTYFCYDLVKHYILSW